MHYRQIAIEYAERVERNELRRARAWVCLLGSVYENRHHAIWGLKGACTDAGSLGVDGQS